MEPKIAARAAAKSNVNWLEPEMVSSPKIHTLIDKSIIKNIFQDLYRQACEVE